MLIRYEVLEGEALISPASTQAQTAFRGEETSLDLDDPFIGLLGEGSKREDLWLGKLAPRYTSYPPATAFRDDVTAETYRAALAVLPAEEPVSLYLHIPFCQSLCLYCGCHTVPTQQHERVAHYLDSVKREIENLALTSAQARRVARIHFGGGSPNLLSERDMGMLFGVLARRFDLSSCREIAMELDPRLITRAQARALRLTGVNRVSLGVQDFDPAVQKAIGREQPYEMVADAYELLRQNDIRAINFDLLYGLPIQSPVGMADTARKVAALGPDRISLFSYAHVPQVKKHQRALEQYILPGPYAALALERSARNVFVEHGYREIGMDHFAWPEDSLSAAADRHVLRRNFQGYTDDASTSLLAIGASGIGRTTSRYFQNAKDLSDYQRRIAANGFATARGIALSGEDKLRAAIIESFMCYLSVNLENICREHNYSLSAIGAEIEALKPYEEAGVITRDGYKIALAVPHRMAVRVIASVFDATQRTTNAPASKAM